MGDVADLRVATEAPDVTGNEAGPALVLEADVVWAHWRPMVRAAYSVLGDRDDAVEAASEALAQVVARPPSGVRNPEAFLVTIAKRRAIDQLRALSSDRRRALLVGRSHAQTEVDVAEAVVDQHEAAWVDETARAVLPAASYELLRLLADGVELSAAARQLGMTTRAAQSRLHRARQVMRTALARTLAGLAALGAGLRKAIGLSGTGAAVLAALFLVAPLTAAVNGPQPVAEPSVHDVAAPTPSPRSTPQLRPDGGGQRTATVGVRPPPATASVVVAPVRPTPQLRTPLGGIGSYDKDDGYKASGPVDLLLHCVQNLHVQWQYQGCDGISPTPTASSTP